MELDVFLRQMVEQDASDLFVTAGMPVSVKQQGELLPLTTEVLTPQQTQNLVFSVMTEKQRHEFENSKECNFALSSAAGRFRVSAFWQREHAGMVLRRIKTDIPLPEDLTLPPVLKELIMAKKGLLLFVGGTGTGKSTSLAALIGYRNQQARGHILTIEDPIEFIHPHGRSLVTQREVGIDTESFDSALKSALRQAPDVVMIGEIRSEETMEYAMAFAETGHLCIATLHANNASQAIERILHLTPPEKHRKFLFDLSLNLRAIVAQQLVPAAEGKGRVAAIEVLLNSPLVSNLISKGEVGSIREVMARSTESGMQTFDQALYMLYRQNRITEAEALHYAESANDLRLMMKLENKSVAGCGQLSGVTIDGF